MVLRLLSLPLACGRGASAAYKLMMKMVTAEMEPEMGEMTKQLVLRGFPDGATSKEPTCPCRRHKRHRFDPWLGKTPWRRKRQPPAVFLPEKSPTVHGDTKSWT